MGYSISPDGRWVLSGLPGETDHLTILPTGAGSARTVKFDGISSYTSARWLPDGLHFLFGGAQPGHSRRCFFGTPEGGQVRPVTPEGAELCGPVSPDGHWLVSRAGEGSWQLFPVAGGEPRPLASLTPVDIVIRWAADGKTLWVRNGDLPVNIYRVDPVSGDRQQVHKLFPADPAGMRAITNIVLTPDGATYAYTVRRVFSRLYLAEGLK